MAAESALQTQQCSTGAQIVATNSGGAGARELRFQSPVTNIFSLSNGATFTFQCKGDWTYKIWGNSGCTTATCASDVPMVLSSIWNLLTNVEGCPVGTVCDLTGGGGGDPLFQQEILMGLAGLFGGLMVAWVIMKAFSK